MIIMPVYEWNQHRPRIDPSAWLAPCANVIGQVEIGPEASIWFSCLVRGDVEAISIGAYTNIQDLSVLHVTEQKHKLRIGAHCTIGHRSILHGCSLADYSFVGIGACVLDACVMGEFSFLAAGSLLPPGKVLEPRTLAMGIPAKPVRKISAAEEAMIRKRALAYSALKESYRDPANFHVIS